jgi:predicted metal-dependent phosphoesterase TrpH
MAAARPEARLLNADLHAHSDASDGALAPGDVVRRARERGVQLLALTDHDTVKGIAPARAAAAALAQPFVAGIELSVTWGGRTVHIVGLGIDPDDADLRAGVAAVRSGRVERGREMGRRLAALGVEGAFDGALALAHSPEMLSRTHFARYLVAHGHCVNMGEVFERYLGENKPGYVQYDWASLTQALAWIKAAGGAAVVAHPGRYKFGALEFDALFSQFKDLGGVAIEVATSSHAAHEVRRYAQVARRYGFEASRGSDFHAPGESDVELGRVAPLPDGLRPVWHRFA